MLNSIYCPHCASDSVQLINTHNHQHFKCDYCGSEMNLNVTKENNDHIKDIINTEVQHLISNWENQQKTDDKYIGMLYSVLDDFISGVTTQQIIDLVEGTEKAPKLVTKNYHEQ